MFGITRRRPTAHAADLAPVSAESVRALPNPDTGGRVDDLGRHAVAGGAQPATDLTPIPGVVSRQLVGGLRTAHHAELLHEAPRFTGGHMELEGRAYAIPAESMRPEVQPGLPSLRVPPPSDPYGRMCNNAAAATARGEK